ncbi:hypothetical protein EJ110_NYTH39740 [Nymphaea thermarum]|nr:hypothetical protein EJ110_NYTH39740 [Nymphaea thermarum]
MPSEGQAQWEDAQAMTCEEKTTLAETGWSDPAHTGVLGDEKEELGALAALQRECTGVNRCLLHPIRLLPGLTSLSGEASPLGLTALLLCVRDHPRPEGDKEEIGAYPPTVLDANDLGFLSLVECAGLAPARVEAFRNLCTHSHRSILEEVLGDQDGSAFRGVPPEHKLTYAMLLFEGHALQWFQYVIHRNPNIGWEEFRAAMMRRFEDSRFADFNVQLKTLTQTGSVIDYQNQFESLSCLVSGWEDEAFVGVFIGGLQPDIQLAVLGQPSRDLQECMRVARHKEEKMRRKQGLKKSYKEVHREKRHFGKPPSPKAIKSSPGKTHEGRPAFQDRVPVRYISKAEREDLIRRGQAQGREGESVTGIQVGPDPVEAERPEPRHRKHKASDFWARSLHCAEVKASEEVTRALEPVAAGGAARSDRVLKPDVSQGVFEPVVGLTELGDRGDRRGRGLSQRALQRARPGAAETAEAAGVAADAAAEDDDAAAAAAEDDAEAAADDVAEGG